MTDPITKYVIQRFLFQWEDHEITFRKASAEERYEELCAMYEDGVVNTRFRLLERTELLLVGMETPDWAKQPV